MLSFRDARAALFAMARPGAIEEVALCHAAGRVLARDVEAARDQPPAAVSAMDGYAVRAADGIGPWRVAGEAAAGTADPGRVATGEAMRIFTGAMLPLGADSVVIQEEVARDGDSARATATAPAAGANVRRAGGDFARGAMLGGVGTRLTPARIGLAAAMGAARLAVFARPRVALLSTGDELVPPGTPPGPGQIVESGRATLTAMLAGLADVIDLGIARDDPARLADAIARAEAADVLVTIGGASVGDHDLVRPALIAAGAEIDFWKVAIRPGKPMLAGRLGDRLVLGLPGNPASAFVTAHLFLLPLLRLLGGHAQPIAPERTARLEAPLPRNGARRDHLRARARWREDGLWVVAAADQDSSLLSVLAASNALVVREPGAAAAAAGDRVVVLDTDSAAA